MPANVWRLYAVAAFLMEQHGKLVLHDAGISDATEKTKRKGKKYFSERRKKSWAATLLKQQLLKAVVGRST